MLYLFILQTSMVLILGLHSIATADTTISRPVTLAWACITCHGPAGRSVGAIPSLHTLTADALLAALQAFRAGTRPGTVMPRLLQGLDEAELAAVAAYFAPRSQP